MSIEALLPHAATLVARAYVGEPDEYGNPTAIETETATRCELQQVGSREENGEALEVTTWRCWLPPETAALDARGWDAIRVDGRTYELSGDVWGVVNPRTGETHHAEAMLTRVE